MIGQDSQNSLIERLSQTLANIDQISEYELICELQQPPEALFNKDALRDPLTMFQCHFILFNALYQLQTLWHEQKFKHLYIQTTRIMVSPYVPAKAGIAKPDSLKDYYLDWANLESTQRKDVEELLARFWRGMAADTSQLNVNQQELSAAFKTLDVPMDATMDEVKVQYRKQLHLHHPDKGGNVGITQRLEWAYRMIKNSF